MSGKKKVLTAKEPAAEEKIKGKSQPAPPKNLKHHLRKLPYFFGIVFTIAILLAGGILFYQNYFGTKDPAAAFSASTTDLVERVGRLMVLPQGEVPTIATVTEKSKLAGQIFFEKSQNGDKVLLFSQSERLAIIYRPSSNQIVNVAPLNVDPAEGVLGASQDPNVEDVSPTPSQDESGRSAPARVVILNGTSVSGLAARAESLLAEKNANVTVENLANATESYDETLIVDLTGKNEAAVDAIAKLIGGKSSSKPDEEAEFENTDILVILGTDFESE